MNIEGTYTPEEEAELDALAIKTWGIESQLDMVVEECAELILAIQKSRRKQNGGGHSVAEELGDVQNCINQFKPLYPEFERIRQMKLLRMGMLLNQELAEGFTLKVLPEGVHPEGKQP